MPEFVIKIDLNRFGIPGQGVLVIDNTERGVPAKGGIRVHSAVTEGEIASLSQEMTRKCLLANLPFGGAKGGICLQDLSQIEAAMYAFGRELAKLEVVPYKWCAAPDVNTDSKCIDAFVAGCASVKGWRKARLCATGKSTGIPHELGSTGYGVVRSIDKVISGLQLDIDLNGAGVIVEGFGEVGGNAVKLLAKKGAKILGVSDVTGYVYSASGLPEFNLSQALRQKYTIKQISEIIHADEFSPDPSGLLTRSADILVLAGPGRSLTEEVCANLKVRLIAEGANIAYVKDELRDLVNAKGIFSIPGIIANAGGVISSYQEWSLENENLIDIPIEEKWKRVKDAIETRIDSNIAELCVKYKECSGRKNSYELAQEIAKERLSVIIKGNRELETETKKINKRLEKKFEVYTS